MLDLDLILADAHGRTERLSVEKEADRVGDRSSSSSDPPEKALSCSISPDGKILALVFDTRVVFKSVETGPEIGEIAYEDSIGGFFLTVESFLVGRSNGTGNVYRVFNSDGRFCIEPTYEIPAEEGIVNAESSVRFCEFNGGVVRVESVCFGLGESLLWKPRISIWSIPQSDSSVGSSRGSLGMCIKLGEGGFPSSPVGVNEMNLTNGESGSSCVGFDDRIVSSSVVLSEDFYAPYAVVYGFYNGEIEVVRFVNICPEGNSAGESPEHPISPCTSEIFFSGHTGAVLCLAAHFMSLKSGEGGILRVLVSGSTDCTVHIWDLDSGSLITVLHHHVAPVKQIILPPVGTNQPWSNCFLSVGEDCCVALVSLETLRVERMFPGHSIYPSMVAWDGRRGYVACLCRSTSTSSDSSSVLYLWDMKSGARERIIKGTASHSMFDNFCRGININSRTDNIFGGTTSASSLFLPFADDTSSSQSHARRYEKGMGALTAAGIYHKRSTDLPESGKGKIANGSSAHDVSSDAATISSSIQVSSQQDHGNKTHPVKYSCPFPGIASLEFDLSSLMTVQFLCSGDKQVTTHVSKSEIKDSNMQQVSLKDSSDRETGTCPKESLERSLLRFSLCFLHLWGVDQELDKLLTEEMDLCKPESFYVSSGVLGDRGSFTLMFPGLYATLELWKSSSEFCAMRSLAIVSLAQHMLSLSHASTTASSALAAFYTRNFAEKVPDIKPPLLQLLVSFWQDPSEHVRMAARSLFHCAAPRAIPRPLCAQRNLHLGTPPDSDAEFEKAGTVAWLESFEIHEWISWIGGTSQDAMASHIIVAAALVVWYPSIVKDYLARLVVNQLIKLVMSMNDLYSSTAAELLAEGMESTWKACIGPEIPRLVGDILFQIECLTGTPANNAKEKPTLAVNMREALVEILLPSFAMADITGFLNVVEGQIWATSSDSPVHLVSLKTLIRVVRGSPKPLAPHLDKVVSYVLQTMDPGNLVMRKACLSSSHIALREIVRAFPMVGMNETSTKLAVGDAIGDIHSVTIRVYDIESVTKIKILDASGPLGLPSLLEGASNTRISTAISALSFSRDGEGLVAFSENGLMIRWWSLGSGWWEKLSRNLVPVQCTKLIFVPPWEGFSPNSSRSSIMASIIGHGRLDDSQDKTMELDDADSLKLLLHNLDLSYRLQWITGRNVQLTRHGQELGTFTL